jgi:hypothetical protein
MIHSGNATVNRREERLLRERLAARDIKLNRALVEVGAVAPAFSDADVEEVGKLLVEGRVRLPKYAKVTVVTEIEERKDPIFGTSEIYHHTADQLCVHALQPMSIPAAIECKLLTKVGGHWLFRVDVYRTMVPADPRLIT